MWLVIETCDLLVEVTSNFSVILTLLLTVSLSGVTVETGDKGGLGGVLPFLRCLSAHT